MKYLLAAAAAALIAGTALADDHASHRTEVVTHDFSGFDRIDVEGVYELRIELGDRWSVRTEASAEDERWRETELNGRTLRLGNKERNRRWDRSDSGENSILAVITMPHLTDLQIAGVATGDVSAFNGGDIDIEVAGVADLTLSGTCDSLDMELEGVGNLDARDLRCASVEAKLGGVGDLSVYASERIDAEVGGIGSIDVYGNPRSRNTSGGFLSSIDIKP